MPLSPGSRLGPYDIIALLGAGGMGEVYRARDPRLGRDVAIKVLPAIFGTDPERRARFAREAQILAALNHPHIAQVYGIEENPPALIMELVDGEGLDAVIASGALPIAEALPVARQIAEALEAAHERGIVHRDLKPANIKLTPEGRVKVLDFGLAKAMDNSGAMAELANSPTFVSAATQLGTILGTAAYMAPEQARGKAVDKRADIWAFGCILFEMLTGRRPFDGETITDILGAIVHTQPDLSQLPAATPPAVTQLIARCLEKDVTRRLRDIGEARVALETTGQVTVLGTQPVPAVAAAPAKRGGLPAWPIAIALAGVAIGASGIWIAGRRPARAVPQLRLNLALPSGLHMIRPPAISRDGRVIAYTAEPLDGSAPSAVYLRRLDGFDTRKLEGSDGASEPFFSPDSRFVGFYADGWLSRAPVDGGAVQPITRSGVITGATWLEDGTIAYSTGVGSPIWRVPLEGGAPEAVTSFDKARQDYAHIYPQWLGGDRVLYSVWTGADAGVTCILSLSAKTSECAHMPSGTLRYTASGHVLNEGAFGDVGVAAAPASLPSFKPEFEPLLHDVFWYINQDRSYFSLSDTGTLVYVAGNPAHQSLAWVTPDGATTPIAVEGAAFGRAVLSPDGTKAAYSGEGSLYVADLSRGTTTRVANVGNNLFPSWAADSRRLYFASNRDERWAIYATSEEDQWAATLVLKRPQSAEMPAVSRDGWIAFSEEGGGAQRNLMMRAPDGTVTTFVGDRALAATPAFSPDGTQLAYASNVTGARYEVFVKPKAGGPAVRVSTAGGTAPSWSARGDTIYYMQGTTVMAAAIDGSGRPGAPRAAIANGPLIRSGVSPSPDGKRFLAVVLQPDALARDVRVVTNFFDDLHRATGR